MIIIFFNCSQVSNKLSKENLLSVVQNNNKEFRVISTIPSGVNRTISESDKLTINFNKEPNFDSCMKALQIFPSIRGYYTGIPMGIEFSPITKWEGGTYSTTLLKSCEDNDGVDLSAIISFQFTVRNIEPSPEVPPPPPEQPFVQAIGLESQICSDSYPGKGSSIGGDWNLNSCFWDSEIPLLPASQYKFRGGDTGNGSPGNSSDCSDKTTDNFKIIFSEYMDPASTVQAVKLRKISVPPSNILLASHSWRDCSNNGCRVLIVRFSEMEASCNGSLFGNSQTGGDFNLQKTENSQVGSQQYALTVESSIARTITGSTLKTSFYFTMEGN